MNNFPLKIIIIGGLCLLITNIYYQRTLCMESPKAELAAYEAMISRLPDQMLVQKYQEEFDSLRKTFNNATQNWAIADINQLPIFKTAILKAMIAEIKKRQEQTQLKLLSPEQIQSADTLIKEQEKRGGK